MPSGQEPDPRRFNTIAMLGQAYSLLGFRIVDGVVGFRASDQAVTLGGLRPDRARRIAADQARRRSQHHATVDGVIVDELEELGYVERGPTRRTGAPS